MVQDLLNFPRGFLFSLSEVEKPAGYIEGPLLDNFYVHPWTNVEFAGTVDSFVIVIGYCVSTRIEQIGSSAAHLLECLQTSEELLLSELDDYGGRYAVLFGSSAVPRVANDATGMQSIFYAVTGGTVASHAILVERALGGEPIRDKLPFRAGYLGNRTPFSCTKILTPNTCLVIPTAKVHRFWPRKRLRSVSLDHAVEVLLDCSATALRNVAGGRSVSLALTAGFDSRTVLAIALHSGIAFDSYTYGDTSASDVDRMVAKDLAKQYRIHHTEIGSAKDRLDIMSRLRDSQYSLHHAAWVPALHEHFSDKSTVVVLGNLLEIGRNTYGPARSEGASPPTDAKSMAMLHHRRVGENVKKRIRFYGLEKFMNVSESAFREFIRDSEYEKASGILEPFVHFYWEHRMATWQGVAMGERDYYAIPFIPFNSRNIFQTMLGVPEDIRRQDLTAINAIKRVDPHLLDIPINPASWD